MNASERIIRNAMDAARTRDEVPEAGKVVARLYRAKPWDHEEMLWMIAIMADALVALETA